MVRSGSHIDKLVGGNTEVVLYRKHTSEPTRITTTPGVAPGVALPAMQDTAGWYLQRVTNARHSQTPEPLKTHTQRMRASV